MGITSGLLAELMREASADPDREICGLLFGDATAIGHHQPTANVASAPHDSFEIDPRALFAALRAERAGGPRVIGHYHSHPGGAPIPSPRDAEAAEPGRYWLILAEGEARLYRAEPGGRFRPVALEIR